MKLCDYSKVDREHMSGTFASVWKQYCLIREDHGDTFQPPIACCASLSGCLVLQTIWHRCWLVGCDVCERTEFLPDFTLGKAWGPWYCQLRTALTVMKLLIQDEHTEIRRFNAHISFASGIPHQQEIKAGEKDRVYPFLCWAWECVLPLVWKGASR